jgi:predicted HicB family RNase H-like nuclease
MTSISHKLDQINTVAEEMFSRQPDWVTFYREIMGLNGRIRRAFPTKELMAEFEQSETYRQIQRMVTELRKRPSAEQQEERVITVRIPQCMHDALRIEAYEHHTSMNKLCISKLLHFVDVENVPTTIDNKLGGKKTEAGL